MIQQFTPTIHSLSEHCNVVRQVSPVHSLLRSLRRKRGERLTCLDCLIPPITRSFSGTSRSNRNPIRSSANELEDFRWTAKFVSVSVLFTKTFQTKLKTLERPHLSGLSLKLSTGHLPKSQCRRQAYIHEHNLRATQVPGLNSTSITEAYRDAC